jgi:hypothetical protein
MSAAQIRAGSASFPQTPAVESVSHHAAARNRVDCFRVGPQAAALFEHALKDTSGAPHVSKAQMACAI